MCAACGGHPKGCAECNAGQVTVTTCPRELVTADVWQALEAADDAEHNVLPMPGGSLSQTRKFMAAWRFIRAEREHWNLILKEQSRGL